MYNSAKKCYNKYIYQLAEPDKTFGFVLHRLAGSG